MKRKTDQIRVAWLTGDRVGALRIAARFFDRSAATKAFKRGMDAYNNPDFYRQLGRDPEQLTAVALELLARNFGLLESESSLRGFNQESAFSKHTSCPLSSGSGQLRIDETYQKPTLP